MGISQKFQKHCNTGIFEIIPSNLPPCPCPRLSGETEMAATSPHLSLKKGKRAAQAII